MTSYQLATPNRVTGMGDYEPPPTKRKEGDGKEPSTSDLFDPVLAGTGEDEYQFTLPKMISKLSREALSMFLD